MVAEVREPSIGREDHLVLFYRGEDELVEEAVGYLGQALRGGEAVVVVATLAHRRTFEARLEAEGVDLNAARALGTWLTRDADATLDSLLDDRGQPDPARFDAVIGALLRRAALSGRTVSAYGEMVALLWDSGQVSATIDLEEQWHRLQDQVSFRLFCAYPSNPVVLDGQDAALGVVCGLHSARVGAVVPTRTVLTRIVRRSFAEAPDSPRAARWFVTNTLREWRESEVLVDDAALVVTELATNAVVHAKSRFSVELRADGDTLTISVEDQADGMPARRATSLDGSSGRGLNLVDELAERWDSERRDWGKVVWAEMRRPTVTGAIPTTP